MCSNENSIDTQQRDQAAPMRRQTSPGSDIAENGGLKSSAVDVRTVPVMFLHVRWHLLLKGTGVAAPCFGQLSVATSRMLSYVTALVTRPLSNTVCAATSAAGLPSCLIGPDAALTIASCTPDADPAARVQSSRIQAASTRISADHSEFASDREDQAVSGFAKGAFGSWNKTARRIQPSDRQHGILTAGPCADYWM